jgi:hypothetical protein
MSNPQYPWNVLPKEDMGDIHIANLFQAVGQALTVWEMMEGTLASIFAGLCGGVSIEGPYRAYGVITGSGGRLDMLSEAYASFDKRNESPFDDIPGLITEVRNFAPRRNEIAHGLVFHFVDHDVDKGHFLRPAVYNSRKNLSFAQKTEEMIATGELPSLHGKYSYNSSQIIFYTEQFEQLRKRAVGILAAFFQFERAKLSGDQASAV